MDSLKKIFRVFLLIILFGLFGDVGAARGLSPKYRLDPNLVKLVGIMKKLENKMSKDDLRMIMALGLVQGALDVKKSMERKLTDTVADLILNLDISDKSKTMPKVEKIEAMIERDRHSIEVLGGALDFARSAITAKEFNMDMKKIYQETSKKRRNLKKNRNEDIRQRLGNLKRAILEHVDMMHKTIDSKTNATVSYLERMRIVNVISFPKTVTSTQTSIEDDVLRSILTDPIEQNLIEISKRQDLNVAIVGNEKETHMEEEQFSEENGGGEEGGGGGGGSQMGLAGLLASLSGGAEGSDIGALFGAVSGVIMNLFGPGGLDVQSLLGSGTALLSGLLAGDRNFGVVLGEYIGTAVDGLAGGGGAIDNGKFFGNLLGTIIAQLSADPEDDEEPPKPQLFFQNFISSFQSAKNKAEVPEDDQQDTPAGSDSFGFIKHVVRAIVGGLTSFILNASLGSSGGSSQGSAGLFSSSPQPKHPDGNH